MKSSLEIAQEAELVPIDQLAGKIGLELAKEHGWRAPAPEHVSGDADQLAGAGSSAGSGPAGSGVSHADAANPRPGPSLGKESS